MCKHPIDLDLKDVDTVAIDIETWDPNLKTKGLGAIRNDGFITGVAVATGKDTVYFSLKHSDDDKSEEELKEFWDQMNTKLLQNDKIAKVFHNAIYDVCWLRATTGKMLKGRLLDTMVAASIIDENRFKYGLDSLAKDFLGENKYKYDLQEKTFEWSGGMQKDPISNMHKLPSSVVKDYAKQDVDLTLKLWNLFNKELDKVLYIKPEDNKEYTCRNIFELETRLFPCLVDMKFKGVRIDTQKLERLGKRLTLRRDNLLKIIKKHTQLDLQLWAATSIKQLLDNRGITNFEKTAKSAMPKLPKDYLKTHEDRFLRMVSKAREADKAVNTFIEGLKGYVYKGRIHADINQIRGDGGGTVTGRFSMSNPNLQQIPSKGYIGKKMRELFIPEEGHRWGSFDYSQQEPRLVVHYAALHKFPSVNDVIDNYENDTSTDFHQVVADMAKIPRSQAKVINLGLFYGMGKAKLQAELGVSKDKAVELFDQYHAKVPFVKQLMNSASNRAQERGQIRTLLGRLCRFHLWEPNQFGMHKALPHEEALQEHGPGIRRAFTYKSLNKLIQGSAADMTKKAMLDLYKNGIVAHVQIHDELCISVKDQEQANKIVEIMQDAVTLEVPNKVDCELANTWGEING